MSTNEPTTNPPETKPDPRPLDIRVGGGAPHLIEQLQETAIPEEFLAVLQLDLDAATHLAIRTYIPKNGLKKTQQKVINQVKFLFKQYGWKPTGEVADAPAN